jgi:glycosyltransferase involved in cell wall biosynthesis
MKIAFFTDAYLPNINGVSYAVETFAKKLAEQNTLEIYAPACGGESRVEKLGRVTVRRYHSVSVPTYKDLQIAFPALTSIIKSVERFNPDIIHIHTPATLGLLGILMAKRMHKPLVGTYHTLFSETLVYASPRLLFEKYLQAIDRVVEGLGIDVKLLKSGIKTQKVEKPDTIPQKMVWGLFNRIFSYADVVLCPTDAIRRELIKRGIKTKVEVLSNGLDLKLFPCKKEYGKGMRMLHVGRLGFEKNVDVVIRAAADVIHKVPGAKLVIAGDGPALGDLKELTSELEISNSVEFLGMVDRGSLGEYYRNSEIFITASTMETQGLVVLEAMSSGLPVVAVKKYALADLVCHGKNGYLVKVGDTRGMSMGIVKLLMEPKLQEKMGRESRKIAETHSLDEVIPKLERIYDQMRHLIRTTWTGNLKTKLETWLS